MEMAENIDVNRLRELVAARQAREARERKMLADVTKQFQPPPPRDAQLIQGKMVDDSDIADGKALVYDATKKTLKYANVGRSRGGGAGVLQELPASYLVFNRGTETVAQDGHTGRNLLADADAATVINTAKSTLAGSPNGGIIFVKRGTYPLSTTVSLDGNNVQLIGEGMSTNFEQLTGNFPAIQVSASYVGLHNFRIYVSGSAFTSSTALRFITSTSTALKDCHFSDLIIQTDGATQAGGTGLGIFTTSTGALYNNKIENVEIYNFTTGLTLDTSSSGWMSANVLEDFYLNTCKYAIIVDGNTNWGQSPHTNTFRSMKVQLAGTTVANSVYVKAYCKYNLFDDLQIYDTTGTHEGVLLNANTDLNKFVNGRFEYFVNNGDSGNTNTGNRLS
jgi:hypothetical protein